MYTTEAHKISRSLHLTYLHKHMFACKYMWWYNLHIWTLKNVLGHDPPPKKKVDITFYTEIFFNFFSLTLYHTGGGTPEAPQKCVFICRKATRLVHFKVKIVTWILPPIVLVVCGAQKVIHVLHKSRFKTHFPVSCAGSSAA